MKRPNILFITTDQHHPGLLGVHDKALDTPNLDKLCDQGMLLDRAYSSCPTCTPSRATWLTGQYAYKHGAWQIGVSLKEDAISLPALLGESGYRTAIFGKSHFKSCLSHRGKADPDSIESAPRRNDSAYFRSWQGPWFGFEHAEINVGHTNEPHSASMHYRAWLEDRGVDIEAFFSERERSGEWPLPLEHTPAAWIGDRCTEWLTNHRQQDGDAPFYVNVNFPEPHGPNVVSEPYYSQYRDAEVRKPVRRFGEWEDKSSIYRDLISNQLNKRGYSRHGIGVPCIGADETEQQHESHYSESRLDEVRAYYGMLTQVDDQIGRILDCLEESGELENTLVLFTADHGDLLGDHFLWGKGTTHYDSCVRVPTIASWPGRIEPGTVCDNLFSDVDIAPTLLSAAGLTPHPEMQGRDATGMLMNGEDGIRDGVLIDFRAEDQLHVNSWITNRYRLSVYVTPEGSEVELYDLQEDPTELTNLAHRGDRCDLVNELLLQMFAYRTETSATWEDRRYFS